MKKIFRYDYNHKMYFITLSVSFLFLLLTIFTWRYLVCLIIFSICTILSFLNSIFVIRNQGIKIDVKKGEVVIVDQLLMRKLKIKEIQFVELRQLQRDKKGNFYGFFHEFFYPYTYMSHCDFVYNQGKVFDIYFHMKNGLIIKSYFGWLYREKEQMVKKIEKRLADFVKEIDEICRENRKAD